MLILDFHKNISNFESDFSRFFLSITNLDFPSFLNFYPDFPNFFVLISTNMTGYSRYMKYIKSDSTIFLSLHLIFINEMI